jgi:hypothetical protein
VLYVTKYIKHPTNIGGIGLGGVGPVAEGFIGLFVGVGICLLAAYWVGDRTGRERDDHGHGDGDDEHGDDDGALDTDGAAVSDSHDAGSADA